MPLPHGKKRYQFSLDEKTVEKLKSLYAQCDAPANALSMFVDEVLEGRAIQFDDYMRMAKSRGQKKFSRRDLERWEFI